MICDNMIKLSRLIMENYLLENDIVIDATCGNGNDTLYLAKSVGSNGKVYAFDIQQEAIENTQKLLDENNIKNVILNKVSHELILDKISADKGKVSVVIFNLGYLPSGNKKITTVSNTTINAINASIASLKIGGIVVLVVYTGHEEGMLESLAVEDYLDKMSPKKVNIMKYQTLNRKNAPYIIAIEKKADDN